MLNISMNTLLNIISGCKHFLVFKFLDICYDSIPTLQQQNQYYLSSLHKLLLQNSVIKHLISNRISNIRKLRVVQLVILTQDHSGGCSQIYAEAVVIWKLDWGWRSQSSHLHSGCWEASAPCDMDLSIWLLIQWQLAFPRVSYFRKVSRITSWRFFISTLFYWTHRPALIYFWRQLRKGISIRRKIYEVHLRGWQLYVGIVTVSAFSVFMCERAAVLYLL